VDVVFLQQYANNFTDWLFWPVVASSVIGALVGLFSFRDYLRSKYAVHSQEYNDNNWRTMAGFQYAILSWVVYGLIAAVPEPNYIVKREVVKQVKYITTSGKYKEAFNHCAEWAKVGGTLSPKANQACHHRAMLFTFPNLKFLTKVKTVVKYKERPKDERYAEAYKLCQSTVNVQMKGNGNEVARQLRANAERCHIQAQEKVVYDHKYN
jgi:hypothetical protein